MRQALGYLEERGFIRPGDQRHAALAKGGRTRPKQYRARVWDLCVDQDPGLLSYLARTHQSESGESEEAQPSPIPTDGNGPVPDSRGASHAPLAQSPASGQGCTTCTPRGASHAPLYKPSGTNHQTNPPVPAGHPPTGGTPQRDSHEPQDQRQVPQSQHLCDVMAECMSQGTPGIQPVPVPKALAGDPVRGSDPRELRAATKLIDEYGLDPVLRVARWALLPPQAAEDGHCAMACGDGYWRGVIKGPRSLARHWDSIVAQMIRDRNSPPSWPRHDARAGQGRPMPTPARIRTPEEERADKLLEPMDAAQGQDGLCNTELAALLTAGMNEQEALEQALAAGRERIRLAAKADRERQEREREEKAKWDRVRNLLDGYGREQGNIPGTSARLAALLDSGTPEQEALKLALEAGRTLMSKQGDGKENGS
ncbi:hypothetical protein CRD60_04660 [Bifidobacterium aemilianum]|uniref:Uncharacterized protein n=1 Tax=Bifidobacterium aemilianum TaxID=2493120 RepID=A0A366K881_9BIFI|nr:hypothetical protein CRD60_04660 [Bifidobacterium aemilianum]